MKRTFGVFSLAMLVFSTFAPSFTYATGEVVEEPTAPEEQTTTEETTAPEGTTTTEETTPNEEISQEKTATENQSDNETTVEISNSAEQTTQETIEIQQSNENSVTKEELIKSEGNEGNINLYHTNEENIDTENTDTESTNEDESNNQATRTTALVSGGEFNVALKKLITGPNANISKYEYVGNINEFTGSSTITDEIISIATNVASGDNIPVYIWNEDGVIKYYTEADKIYLDKDSSYMFAYLPTITHIDLSKFDTSFVTNMSNMFAYCYSLQNIDVSNFNTRNVTQMGRMFYYCTALTELDVSNFVTSGVTYVYQFAAYNSNLVTLNISNWDISGLNDQWRYFTQYDEKLKNVIARNMTVSNELSKWYAKFFGRLETIELIDATGWKWNMTKETNMYEMFYYAKKLKVLRGLETWDVSNVTNMGETFRIMYDLEELNISNWDVSNVTNMYEMFQYNGLRKIDISGWELRNIENMDYMFQSFGGEEIDMSNIIVNNQNGTTSFRYLFQSAENLKKINMSNADLSSVKSTENLFQQIKNLEEVDLSNAILNNVTTMKGMFESSKNLQSINLVGVQTDKLESMKYMFNECNGIVEINLSSFDTTKVTNMQQMFGYNYNLEAIYVGSKFSTGNVITGNAMFYDARKLPNYSGSLIGVEHSSRYLTFGEYSLSYNYEDGVLEFNKNKYYVKEASELPRATKQGYEFLGWYEEGSEEEFKLNGTKTGNKTLYAKWKSLVEKSEETTTENVVYTNNTTVTVGDETTEEVLSGSTTLKLVSEEVKEQEVTKEEDKTTVKESEIKVTSDKKVEYEGGLEVYLEKTEDAGTENETTGKVEGTIKFSAPIAVKIPVSSDVSNVKIQVKHGDEDFGFKGLTLNPVNECNNGEAVNDKYNGEDVEVKENNGEKYATIYTCSASIFVAYTETQKPTISQPSRGTGRPIKQTIEVTEEEHNSADTEVTTVEEVKTSNETIEQKVKKVEGKTLTRGEVAVMTNILLDVYPKLTENRTLNEVTEACENYTDEQDFTKDEKKAITRLCKLSIMGIHNDNKEPLDEFLVKQKASNGEFATVMDRVVLSYNEKDLTTVKDALKKLEGDDEGVVFGTVYNVFMSIKNIFN